MKSRNLSNIDGGRSGGNKNYFGLYRAKCLNNEDPDGLGRILVHIYETDGKFSYDEESHQWIPVLSPFGGVPQMGLFMIPPINSEGYVVFEKGNVGRPVWIGSYNFSPQRTIDEEASEAAGYTVIETQPTVPQESNSDATKIVLKTQYPTQQDPDPTSNENTIENVVSMDEDNLELRHVNKNNYQYSIGGTEGVSGSFIRLGDTNITLGVRNSEGEIFQLVIDTESIRMESPLGDNVQLYNGRINIQTSKSGQLNIQSEDGAVNINGKNVVLDGESIVSGTPGALGGGGAVTSDTVCPFVGLPIHIGSSKTIIGG